MHRCTLKRTGTVPDIAPSIAAPDPGPIRGAPLTNAAEILNHASTATVVQLDAAGAPPAEIQLFPMGRVEGRDGRGPWVLEDQAHAEAVIAATRALVGPQDMMIDYDHQAVFAVGPGKGGQAEAAGWVALDSLVAKADGIWGRPSWTGAAAAKLADKAYRYLSPYFGSDKATGRLTRIFNVGLVNQPAIREIAAAASIDLNPGNPEPMKKILAALGLKDDATEDAACASVAALTQAAASAEHLAAAAAALGLKPEATGEEVVTAATAAIAGRSAATPDPKEFVPIATHNAAMVSLGKINEERATAAVDKAIAGGIVAPDNRQWALDYFTKDEAGFTAFVQRQPVILSPGRSSTAGKVEAGQVQLTDEDRQAAAALGVTEADFLKTRESEVAQ